MKVTDIQLGQAIRLVQVFNPTGGVYLPDFIGEITKKYNFLGTPADLSQYLSGQENVLTFSHGKFNETIIRELKIYNDGIVVNTSAYVEEADAFIDDALGWFLDEYGYSIKEHPPVQKMLTSQLEVQMDINLDKWIDRVNILASQINKYLIQLGIVMHYICLKFIYIGYLYNSKKK